MHAHPHLHPGAGASPPDRASDIASSSSGAARRWLSHWKPSRLTLRALKPVTYSLMHLTVAITVAYALTRDWRIALGVGVIEPMVQTVAYMLHEKAWSAGSRKQA